MRALLALAAALVFGLPAAAQAQQCEYPGVLVVLDRSISMLGTIGGVTKWDIARSALDGMLEDYGAAAQFGLMIYPGPSGTGANGIVGPVGACRQNNANVGCTPEAPRCTTGEVVVDIAANTRQAILNATIFPDTLSNSYTPTWQSLAAARQYPRLAQANRRNFAVLITDGWQCCGLRNNGTECEPEDRNFVVQQVQGLLDQDVTTFVIGFGGLVDVQTLQRAATAGGAPRPGCNPAVDAPAGQRCYFQADSAAQLQGFLDDIVRQISVELCDGLDNDCDGVVDEGVNRACNTGCGAGQERCVNGRFVACDAAAPAAETCNGRDDDCDGRTDENLTRGCQNQCGVGQERCVNGAFAACDAPQPVAEVCDGIDNNCNGTADEGCDCRPGETRACGDDRGACRPGQQTCQNNGTWGACQGAVGPVAETCNGDDDDCDGQVDNVTRPCNTACGDGQQACVNGAFTDCTAPVPGIEVCNGVDDDCDGRADENVTRACSNECGGGVETCNNGTFAGCNAPRPAPSDICGNGDDDDCDGRPDEGCECEDGAEQTCGRDRGQCTPGRQQCAGGQWGDCLGATTGGDETCDGYDNDCDGRVDEGDLCGAGEYCACGGCNQACQNNECARGLTCTFGYCVEDNCPDGQMCQEGQCVPGDGGQGGEGGNGAGGFGGAGNEGGGRIDQGTGSDLGTSIAGSGVSAGCSCDTADNGKGSAPVAALALLGLLGLSRRRRS